MIFYKTVDVRVAAGEEPWSCWMECFVCKRSMNLGEPGTDCLGPHVTPKSCAEAPPPNVCEAMRTLGGNSWGWGAYTL